MIMIKIKIRGLRYGQNAKEGRVRLRLRLGRLRHGISISSSSGRLQMEAMNEAIKRSRPVLGAVAAFGDVRAGAEPGAYVVFQTVEALKPKPGYQGNAGFGRNTT
jgi:hypothetical protein